MIAIVPSAPLLPSLDLHTRNMEIRDRSELKPAQKDAIYAHTTTQHLHISSNIIIIAQAPQLLSS